MTEAPRFAVVGRVNKGKSSVIATLAEDDRVAISPIPGTTQTCAEFPVVVDGFACFVLVDTPGFEQAPAALEWLERTGPSADARLARVEAFVATHTGSGAFAEECELLRPILAGAAILYVVDGTRPYREYYQSEMEILRWTGRPSMALINRIGSGDHAASWRSALGQYFKVVRDFDAHTASFEERVRLLETFRELHDPWRDRLARAVDALTRQRTWRRAEVVHEIADLLIDALTLTIEATWAEQADPRALESEFHDALRQRERRARRDVEGLYSHSRVDWEHEAELERPVFGEDLFAERTWSVLGLSPTQALAAYTISGAVTGGMVDASVGGLSFGAGASLGALVGAGAGLLHLQQRFTRQPSTTDLASRVRRALSGQPTYRIGPLAHPSFPFILLDRALLHFDAVRTRAHARSAAAAGHAIIEGQGKLTAEMTREDRQALTRVFTQIRKHHDDVPHKLRAELGALVERAVARLDGGLD